MKFLYFFFTRFTTREFAGLGASITSINGLQQNTTSNYFWSIGKIVDGQFCLLPVGKFVAIEMFLKTNPEARRAKNFLYAMH